MRLGFKLTGHLELTTWKPCAVYDMELVERPTCCIDGSEMQTVVALVSLSCPERIELGMCPACGLIGYTRAPSEAAVRSFYARQWMNGETVVQATAKARDTKASEPMPVRVSETFDRAAPILEIGAGYGRTIHALQSAGLSNLHATEHNEARAAAVRDVFGVPVNEPLDYAKSIMHHHVIEHVCDPDAFIADCAAKQRDGDVIEVSCPCFAGEPSMGVVFFWPHLWSFLPSSLGLLLRKHGYRIINTLDSNDRSLHFLAKKNPPKPLKMKSPPLKSVVHKLAVGLGLVHEGPQVLTWQREFDGASWAPQQYSEQEAKHGFPRRIVVEPVRECVTDAPIEIQFPGRVEMYWK